MIVGHYFKGDDNKNFQWLQHDSYSKTLWIIVDACRSAYIERFKNDPENEIVPALESLTSFDHRVLQAFHDHLAAYWRKNFLNPKMSAEENLNEWFSWVQNQMRQGRLLKEVYIRVCFLALDKYDKDHEERIIEGLQSYASKTYPLKASDYIKKIPLETGLNIIYFCIALYVAVWVAQNAFKNLIQHPYAALVLTAIFSVVGIYAFRKELHDLGAKNINSWAFKLLTIFSVSFGIALLFMGIMNSTNE